MFKQKSQKHPNLKNIQKHKEIPTTYKHIKHANNNTETKLPNSLLLILQKNRDI